MTKTSKYKEFPVFSRTLYSKTDNRLQNQRVSAFQNGCFHLDSTKGWDTATISIWRGVFRRFTGKSVGMQRG